MTPIKPFVHAFMLVFLGSKAAIICNNVKSVLITMFMSLRFQKPPRGRPDDCHPALVDGSDGVCPGMEVL